ncbi:MAG: hypothetical protein K0R71_1241 [Bacillales bacterium]|jgi:uncharacterized protein YuzB (UPF0349 family)|nr:hypothetical protein [Bacillales bacterium]
MKPLIEFCKNNIASCSQIASEKLQKDRSLDIIEYHCLGYCGKCSQMPFALLNGERVYTDTSEELVEKIYKYIDKYDIG